MNDRLGATSTRQQPKGASLGMHADGLACSRLDIGREAFSKDTLGTLHSATAQRANLQPHGDVTRHTRDVGKGSSVGAVDLG
jgi:hypothetical protein